MRRIIGPIEIVDLELNDIFIYQPFYECKMIKQSINILKSQNNLSGGMIYELMIGDCLQQKYNVNIYDISSKLGISSILENILRNLYIRKEGSINIRNYISTLDKLNSRKEINISILHHYDPSTNKSGKAGSLLRKFTDDIYFNNLSKMDVIVVVARYWESFVRDLGIKNVQLIYNSFDVSKYAVSESEVERFAQKYNLSKSKRTIFLGSSLRALKGVQKAYEQLKRYGYQFIATGNRVSDGDIKVLKLNYKEYITLLRFCDLVLSVSEFKEGWNRIAHEALLVKTPVIGSGMGGMRELLENAGQVICEDMTRLPDYVDLVFNNYGSYSNKGYHYVKSFDLHYFTRSWVDLVESLVQRKKWG